MKEHARATGCQPRLAAIHEATSHGAEIESSWRASSLLTWRRSFHWTARIDSGTRPLTYSALASSPEAASRLELRPSTPMGERDKSRSLATAAGGDVPDGFDLGAAHGVDAIVQIDSGVAVRREELHELTERGHAALLRHESAVLIARPRVFDTRPLDRFGDEGLVRRERLEAAVDHGHGGRGHAHHGGQHGQRHLEVLVVSSALAADAPVAEVPHAAGARRQLRQPGEIAADVESAV